MRSVSAARVLTVKCGSEFLVQPDAVSRFLASPADERKFDFEQSVVERFDPSHHLLRAKRGHDPLAGPLAHASGLFRVVQQPDDIFG